MVPNFRNILNWKGLNKKKYRELKLFVDLESRNVDEEEVEKQFV